MSELGLRLKALREKRGLSQDEVARLGRALGEPWSRSTVAKWEKKKGQRDVTLEEFFTLAMILNIPPGRSLRELTQDLVPHRATRLPPGAKRGPGEAEQKAALGLGVTPAEVSRLAKRRWNATLTAKRERRLKAQLRGKGEMTPRTLQAMRGRVTRGLLAELRNELNQEE